MDQATIQQIAEAVAREVYAPHWTVVVLGFILAPLASGGGAYFGAYLKRKGENFATKEDFASGRRPSIYAGLDALSPPTARRKGRTENACR